jgi:hypothetical protein
MAYKHEYGKASPSQTQRFYHVSLVPYRTRGKRREPRRHLAQRQHDTTPSQRGLPTVPCRAAAAPPPPRPHASRRSTSSRHAHVPLKPRERSSRLSLLTRSSLPHPTPPQTAHRPVVPRASEHGPRNQPDGAPHPHHSPFHPSPSPLLCSTAPLTSPPRDTRSINGIQSTAPASSSSPLASTQPKAAGERRGSWRATATGRAARRRQWEATATAGTRAGRTASGGRGSCPPSSSPASRCSPWRCTRTTAPRTVAGSAGASPASCGDSPSSRSARTRSSGRPLPRTFLLQADLSFC